MGVSLWSFVNQAEATNIETVSTDRVPKIGQSRRDDIVAGRGLNNVRLQVALDGAHVVCDMRRASCVCYV